MNHSLSKMYSAASGSRRSIVLLIVLALAVVLTGCGSVASTGLRSTQSASRPLVFADQQAWGSTWSYNPFAASYDGIVLNSLVMLELTAQYEDASTSYYYSLASHFTIKGQTVTIQLRKGAKWQNGAPVTSKDVLVTMLIDAMEGPGVGVWPYISSVSLPSSKSLTIVVSKGYSPVTFVQEQVSTITPVPASEYEDFLPKGHPLTTLEADAMTENSTNQSSPAALRAKKLLESAFGAVSKYDPTRPLGDGPYRLASQTSDAARLVKSSTYYNRKKVHVQDVTVENFATTPMLLASLEHGAVDYAQIAFSNALQAQQLNQAGVHLLSQVANHGWDFYFNVYKYPFNILQVRQAIAYAADIPSLIKAGVGTARGVNVDRWWPAQKYTDGLSQIQGEKYLTSSTTRALNGYSYSTSKAASLLESVGFHKKGGVWITPQGKPFSFDILLEQGYNDEPGLHLASVLDSFGIKASAIEEPEQELITALDSRDLNGLSYLWGQESPNPLGSLVAALSVVPAPRESGYEYTVPGLGHVNIFNTLEKEEDSVGPGEKFNSLVNSWARFFTARCSSSPTAPGSSRMNTRHQTTSAGLRRVAICGRSTTRKRCWRR